MDINSISTGAPTAATARQVRRPDGDANDVGTTTAAATSPGMSAIAQDMSQLQTLQQQDPAKFKEVMAQIASQMQAAAQAQPQNGALAKIAGDFQQAAQTGQMPAVGGKGGHHHHHAHAATPPDAAAATLTQAANTNTGVSTYTKADRESAWQAAEKAISGVLSQVSQ